MVANGLPPADVVLGSRIGAASLREGALFHAPAVQQPRQPEVSLDAARLVINPVVLVALSGELLLHGPWSGPHGRIFDQGLVGKGPWPGARPAFDQVQVLARPENVSLG